MVQRSQLSAFLVLLLLGGIVFLRHLHVPGEDLSSSYVGCRLVATHQIDHLYAHDPVYFNVEDDDAWNNVADNADFDSNLHPYVQTPLWAWSLQPLCMHTDFPAFMRVFVFLLVFCSFGTLWLVARHWAPVFLHPLAMALLCIGFVRSEPFLYSIFLVQTHAIYVFMTVAAILLARRHSPIAAGGLLALAAAVKITPGFLLLYWLVTRQWKAAISFVLSSVALVAFTALVLGPSLLLEYLHEVQRISNLLLLAYNNQSLAATWMTSHFPPSLYNWQVFPLAGYVKVTSTLLCLVSPLVGGWFDREHPGITRDRPPYGAVFTMVATTVFTSLAWTHYFILLVIPVMLLVEKARRRGLRYLLVFVVPLIALNYYPLAYGAVAFRFRSWSLVHSHFYAGLIALAGLAVLALRRPTDADALPLEAEGRDTTKPQAISLT